MEKEDVVWIKRVMDECLVVCTKTDECPRDICDNESPCLYKVCTEDKECYKKVEEWYKSLSK